MISKFVLSILMKRAHVKARILIENGKTDVYAIAFQFALKEQWAEKKDAARISANKEARHAAKARSEARSAAMNKPAQKSSYTSRTVVSLAAAQRDGLNHGRAWVCGEMDIIRKGALPEWEGDLICYVYN